MCCWRRSLGEGPEAFLSGFGSFLLLPSHVAGLGEIRTLVTGISFVGFTSGILWLAYIATEPYMRRDEEGGQDAARP
jgi:hypothetical protein